MIEIHFGAEDLARLRFARSPIQELIGSLQLLGDAPRQLKYLPWMAATTPKVAKLRLELLPALVGGPHWAADFLTPPPEHLDTDFTGELERVRATPPEAVRKAVDTMRGSKPIPRVLGPLYEHPEATLGRVADELRTYWNIAIEPIWPRLRALADADLGYRAQAMTTGGLARLLADLNPLLERSPAGMRINTTRWEGEHILHGCGLVLVPCVFAWPQLIAKFDEPRQSMLTYAPRGIGTLWADSTPTPSALNDLIGRSRVGILLYLDLPLSTTQLAGYLGLSAATISQHLSVLRRTNMVTSRRSGRTVLYERTLLATQLLDAQT